MIQSFLLLDFLGLFFGRLVLALSLIKDFNSSKNKIRYLYLILAISIFLGYYSSFAFIVLIVHEFFWLIYSKIFSKQIFQENLLRLALASVYLVVGPGFLSIDNIFDIRF
ncbi:MAG: hypothetical protein NZ822_02285 [Patescibacteria group bacterium]|nr:hypothetical protein [Patescibacteria group bacterium]